MAKLRVSEEGGGSIVWRGRADPQLRLDSRTAVSLVPAVARRRRAAWDRRPTVCAVDEERDWDREAENWVRWARTPGYDAYWRYRDAFFEQMVPAPGRRTVEIGCGEGRVARDL